MRTIFPSRHSHSQGQTLVETVVGIFVLTIGISTALGLAISMFNASTSAVKQVIGAGLAREGVEAIFNMRATNWLKGSLVNTCWNYPTNTSDASCHRDWLRPESSPGVLTAGAYDLSVGGSYTVDQTPTSTDSQSYWNLYPQGGSPNYRLYYDASASTGLLYKTTAASAVPSEYYREVVLTLETPSYYQASIGNRLKVTSRVWWDDKGCPSSSTWPTSGKCRIELVTYLTNWRNY